LQRHATDSPVEPAVNLLIELTWGTFVPHTTAIHRATTDPLAAFIRIKNNILKMIESLIDSPHRR